MPKSFTQMKHPQLPSPAPLHRTPLWLRMFGYGPWRYYDNNMAWRYLSAHDYDVLFRRQR